MACTKSDMTSNSKIEWPVHPFAAFGRRPVDKSGQPEAHYEVADHLPEGDQRRPSPTLDLFGIKSMGIGILPPKLVPTHEELSIIRRHFRDVNPATPPWERIGAMLRGIGVSRSTIHRASSAELVLMLGRLAEGYAGQVSDEGGDPEILAELQRIRQLGVNQQQAALTAFRINQRTRRKSMGLPQPTQMGAIRETPINESNPSADTGSQIRQRQPDNVDVRDLCKLLEENQLKIKAGAKSEIGVAREFTREQVGNCPKAQNLLRQARRYPHLWKQR
jgi:hypothetical protein